MIKVTAIFDVGKTNKKFILFDNELNVVYNDYIQFEEIQDEDGHPCDDLLQIQKWIISNMTKLINAGKYQIEKINFSTYGASLVHIDKNGNALTPIYNYTKSIDQHYIDKLYDTYGGMNKLSKETASPPSGMLNSGIQLFWLKYHRPEIYSKIEYSLHLPQYLSFYITGQPISDYTSIGCHTMLWDYDKKHYHQWVLDEGLDSKLAPIVTTDTKYMIDYNGQNISIGTGIHDSSAALLPYLIADSDPFILISTGTWNVTLNPLFRAEETCLNPNQEELSYMTKNGNQVKAARVFLGNEYKLQVSKLIEHFEIEENAHKNVLFDVNLYRQILTENKHYYHFKSIDSISEIETECDLSNFPSFEYAYHQLMHELMEVQVASTKCAIANTEIKKIYIDGGFIDNDIFIKLLAYNFANYEILTAKTPIGSEIGAALMINNMDHVSTIFRKQFNIKKHQSLIFDAQ